MQGMELLGLDLDLEAFRPISPVEMHAALVRLVASATAQATVPTRRQEGIIDIRQGQAKRVLAGRKVLRSPWRLDAAVHGLHLVEYELSQ